MSESTDQPVEAPEVEPDVADEVVPVEPPPVTGDPEVDAALGALAEAVQGQPEQQVAGYDAAYRTLQDRLADVEG